MSGRSRSLAKKQSSDGLDGDAGCERHAAGAAAMLLADGKRLVLISA